LESITLANNIAELIFNKKGYGVKILDLKEVATFTDYFVICSADSDTQVKAIADEIDKSLRDSGLRSWHKEGYRALNWVLIDYVDVVRGYCKKLYKTREEYERLNLPEKVKELNGEIAIVEEYLPKQLSEDEIRKIVKETVETNKFTAKEMGLAMKQIMSKCGSVADGKKVQMILKEMLSC